MNLLRRWGGAVLCTFGIHRWGIVTSRDFMWLYGREMAEQFHQCRRCGETQPR